MKKLILVSLILFAAIAVSGQTLKKGVLIGFHNGTYTLNTGVTQEQYVDFILKKYIPAVEKAYPGVKAFLLKGVRGEAPDTFSMMMVFESEAARNKFWNPDNTSTDAGAAATKMMEPVVAEWNKLGTMVDKYTDWIIL